ncbi:RNA-dependent RNA polymerase [Hubei diptera virus 5]|uniref:RNA-directed RNA polymerase L n=1 Tax=Hubei diptera virus 5 TaxID=1922886 RepID=A0A1L3KPJ1_9VIRU|nr:RNA-dependent RNA polymerase [Hubei diptera virus 5]APG79288.1 RNA-dependent RNA polymerase [Hubei diptera virus 5]
MDSSSIEVEDFSECEEWSVDFDQMVKTSSIGFIKTGDLEIPLHHSYPSQISQLELIPYEIRKVNTGEFELLYQSEHIGSRISTGSSIKGEKISFKSGKLLKFVHDYVFGCLVSGTDIKISSKIPGVHSDPGSRMTPDFISAVEGGFSVVEFATTRGDPILAYMNKINKYSIVLQSILNTYNEGKEAENCIGISLFVIVVGQNEIISNMSLSQMIRDELSYRFKMAISINSNLREEGIISREFNESDDLLIKRMKQFFHRFNSDPRFINTRTDEWSDKNYEKMMEDPNSKEMANIEKAIFEKSYESAIGDINNLKPIGKDKKELDSILEAQSISKHNDFENEYLKINEENMRDDMKAMVQFPLIVPILINGNRSLSVNLFKDIAPLLGSEILEARMWSEAILDSKCNSDNFPQIDDDNILDTLLTSDVTAFPQQLEDNIKQVSNVVSKVTMNSKMQNTLRNSYQRIIIDLTKEEEKELAKGGIYGKKYSNCPEVKEDRKEKKRFFDIKDTLTDDLDDLLEDHDFLFTFFNSNLELNNTLRGVIDLIQAGWTVHKEKNMTGNLILALDSVCKTPYFHFCKFISDVAVEISISLKQNCSRRQFILKKLKDWNVWLLIKPTKSTSHIFYSLLGLNKEVVFESNSSVFKKVFKVGDYWITPFVSSNISKLTNLCLCESRAFGILSFWSHASKVAPFKLTSDAIHSVKLTDFQTVKSLIKDGFLLQEDLTKAFDSYFMTIVNLLVSLIDKTEVEEEITKTRYIVMESLVEWPLVPDVNKMLSKTCNHFKSRFTLWLYRKHRNYTVYLSSRPIKLISEKVCGLTLTNSHLRWVGFRNPYLDKPISDIQLVINLFYLGYIRNKDQYPENNTLSKLYKKILDLEDKFTAEVNSRIGRIDKPLFSGTRHEYNITIMKSATDFCINNRLINNRDYLREVELQMADFLCNSNIEDSMTTLKASSRFGPRYYNRDEVNSDYSRIKVIEAIQPYIKDDKVFLIDVIEEVYPEVFTQDCLHIDIFQKNQHGGLREIFVLSITNRILQYFIETVSRILCGSFEGETMTHPINKKIIPENHQKKTALQFKSGFITLCTSADASKWSQNQYSHKFAIMLYRFLPRYMHNFINRILRLWQNKKILINPLLLKMFDTNPRCLFYDDIIQTMYNGYHGHENVPWISSRSPYIRVKSGMMQGILHYTSSLFHSVINEYVQALMMKRYVAMVEVMSKKYMKISRVKPVISMMQSSDDSCMIYSVSVNDLKDLHYQQMIAATMQMFKIFLGEEVAIINSSKSSVNTKFLFEFNSNFEFGSSHYKPDIKHVFSANLISEEELLAARQEELSTLLTIYLESGGYTYIANFLQIGQALLNYRLLGSSTTNLFDTYVLLIRFLPDPASGFFLMDNPLCPGICGFKYNLWSICQEKNMSYLYKYYLNEIVRTHENNESKKVIEATQSGTFMQTTKLSYGNREKWMRLAYRMNLPEDWKQYFETKPNVLYRKGLTTEEFKNRVAMKMHSPGVASSLSKGNCVSRTISASCFILKVRSLSNETSWLDPKKTFHDRFTLLESLLDSITNFGEESLTSEDLKKLFPFAESYRDTHTLLTSIKISNKYQTHSVTYKRNLTDIYMFESASFPFESPATLIPYVWFGHMDPKIERPNYSESTINQLFQKLVLMIPWLDRDPEVSLKKSPFSNHLELKTWIEKLGTSVRTVRLLGAPISTRAGLSSLPTLIFQNFACSYKLIIEGEHKITKVRASSINLKHYLLLAATMPNLTHDETAALMKYFLNEFYCDLKEDSRSFKRKNNSLFIMAAFASKSMDILGILNKVRTLKSGVIGGFTKRQKMLTKEGDQKIYTGEGEWIGMIDGKKIKLVMFGDGVSNKLMKVYMKEPSELNNIYSPLINLLQELNIEVSSTRVRPIYDTKIFLSMRGLSHDNGVPIYSEKEENIPFDLDQDWTLKLDWSGYSLRLQLVRSWRYKSPQRARFECLPTTSKDSRDEERRIIQDYESPITILNYVPHESDLMMEGIIKSSKVTSESKIDGVEGLSDLEKKWLDYEPLDYGQALAFMDEVYRRFVEVRDEQAREDFKKFSENLRSLLGSKNVRRKTKMSLISTKAMIHKPEESREVLKEVMDLTVDDDFIHDLLEEIGMEKTDEEEESEEEDRYETQGVFPDLEDYMGEAEQLIESLSKPTDIIRNRNSRVFTQHPLLKRYASRLLEEFPVKKIRKMFEDLTIEERDSEHKSAICIFNEITKNEIIIKDAYYKRTGITYWRSRRF